MFAMRYAVFADAGYLWVQFGQILKGEPLARTRIEVDPRKMADALLAKAESLFPGKEFLRVYWYDGNIGPNLPIEFNRSLAAVDGFKLRYGTINTAGQQKGVDGLLMADLLSLAQNHAISDALLISGDGDLAPGVAAAQAFGIRVHRLELGPSQATSPMLRNEVDANSVWETDAIREFIALTPAAEQESPKEALLPAGVMDAFWQSLTPEERHALASESGADIPGAIDKKLLFHVKCAIGRMLTDAERAEARTDLKTRSAAFSASGEALTPIAAAWLRDRTDEERGLLRSSGSTLSPELDRSLLHHAKTALGRFLSDEEKIRLRTLVRAQAESD